MPALCPNAYGNHQLVAGVLRRAGRPLSLGAVRAEIGGDIRDVRGMLDDAIAAGLVVFNGGMFALVWTCLLNAREEQP